MITKRFESVSCKFLQNVECDNSWMCVLDGYRLPNADYCYKCKFDRLRKKEGQISRRKKNG